MDRRRSPDHCVVFAEQHEPHPVAELELPSQPSAGAPELLLRLRERIVTNLASSPLPIMARELGLSSRTLQRMLNALGTGMRAELQRARVEAAQRLLVEGDDSVDQVARRVGCASNTSLSRLFRRNTGETPGAYRRRRRA